MAHGNLADLFQRMQAPPEPPKIQIDARKLGEPWWVEEASGDVYLMYDEMTIAMHPTYGCMAAQFVFKGSVVHTEKLEGCPGFTDPDGVIHLTELHGKLKVQSAVPSAG
jgi:hypothetical protein